MGKIKEDILKNFLEEYLILKGVHPQKNFRCFSPEHEDKHPSMSFYKPANICNCFACGKKYDIFSLVGLEYGISNRKEQIEKVEELYLHREKIKNINEGIYSKKNIEVLLEKNITLVEFEKKKKNLEEYFQKCKKSIYQTDYLEKRGISQKIIEKYNIGYDYNFLDHITKKRKKAIIIPLNSFSFVSRSIEENEEHKDRYRRIGNDCLFGESFLQRDGKIFIVEGEFDALSILTQEKAAISCPTQFTEMLLKKIEKNKKDYTFFLAFDQDDKGRKAQDLLKKEFIERNIKYFSIKNLFGYKDMNEFLQKDSNNFEKFIKNIEIIIELEEEFCKKNIFEKTFEYIYKYDSIGKYNEKKAEEAIIRVLQQKIPKEHTEKKEFLLKALSKNFLFQYQEYSIGKKLSSLSSEKIKIKKKKKTVEKSNER